MAGVGGALWGASKGAVTSIDFVYVQSLVLLLILTIGGVNTITGAFLGGMFLAVANIINPHLPERYQQLTLLATGLGAMTIARNPNGVAGELLQAVERVRTRLRGRPAAPASLPEEVGVVTS